MKMWTFLTVALLLFGAVHPAIIEEEPDDIIELSETSDPDVISEVIDLLKDEENAGKLMEAMFEDIDRHYSMCSCHHDECKCCRGIHLFHMKMEVCVRLLYAFRHNNGYFVIQADVLGHVVYKREIDENHFLTFCHQIRIGSLRTNVCVRIAEVEMEPGHFSGCLDLVKPIKKEIACFKLRVSSDDDKKKVVLPWDRFRH